MNRQDIANLALKITGLYCLIKVIEEIKHLIWLVRAMLQISAPGIPPANTVWLTVFLGLIPLAMLAALAYALIAHGKKWSQRIFPDSESPPSPDRVLAIHALAYSIIGILAIVDALHDLAQNLINLGLFAKGSAMDPFYGCVGLIAPLLKLTLGLSLFFGSHGLVRIWSRLRYSGLRRQLGLCVHCSYDLTGNTSGICPECGTPIAPKPPASCIQ